MNRASTPGPDLLLQLVEPATTVPVSTARPGDPVEARRADRTVLHATMLSRSAAPGHRFVLDASGDAWEIQARTGQVTAGPRELARRTRVATLAAAVELVGAARDGKTRLHLGACGRIVGPRRARLRPAETADEYRQAVEAGEAACPCLSGRL